MDRDLTDLRYKEIQIKMEETQNIMFMVTEHNLRNLQYILIRKKCEGTFICTLQRSIYCHINVRLSFYT